MNTGFKTPLAMEDAFFAKEESRLIEQLHRMKKMAETKENLAKVSGIHDDAVLQKLVDMDIRPETVASLSLIPLIEVAWADGHLDEKEREALVGAIHEFGAEKGDIDYELVEGWTRRRPAPALLSTWEAYVGELCGRLTVEERANLKEAVLHHAKEVAEASGGLLGLGIGDRISAAEKDMLARLEKAFN